MENYKASLDTVSKIITGFVLLLGVAGIVRMCTLQPWYSGIVLVVISIVILVPTYMYSVKSYELTNEKLIIHRAFSKFNKEIPLAEIESASLTDIGDFKWTVRTAGNGGLFGYTGLYANPKLGNFRVYATKRSNRILIILKTKGDKIVITPDDAGMADELQKLLKKQA
jgi:hypothetical protein